MESPASSRQPIGFLDLPCELRLEIYSHCLPQRRIFEVSPLLHYWPYLVYDSQKPDAGCLARSESPSLLSFEDDQFEFKSTSTIKESRYRRKALPGLLQLSRQISDEALDVLYGGNIFKVVLHDLGQWNMKTFFRESNRRRIQQLMLILRPIGVSYRPDFKINTAMWDEILPRLTTLWIVAEQPMERSDGYWGGQALIKEWIGWLTPILEYLAKTLPTKTTVLIDVDERKETYDLIRKYLLYGCCQVKTSSGDFVFKRGRFSIEFNSDDDDSDDCRDIYGYDSGEGGHYDILISSRYW